FYLRDLEIGATTKIPDTLKDFPKLPDSLPAATRDSLLSAFGRMQALIRRYEIQRASLDITLAFDRQQIEDFGRSITKYLNDAAEDKPSKLPELPKLSPEGLTAKERQTLDDIVDKMEALRNYAAQFGPPSPPRYTTHLPPPLSGQKGTLPPGTRRFPSQWVNPDL